jgi:hypothetical protein
MELCSGGTACDQTERDVPPCFDRGALGDSEQCRTQARPYDLHRRCALQQFRRATYPRGSAPGGHWAKSFSRSPPPPLLLICPGLREAVSGGGRAASRPASLAPGRFVSPRRDCAPCRGVRLRHRWRRLRELATARCASANVNCRRVKRRFSASTWAIASAAILRRLPNKRVLAIRVASGVLTRGRLNSTCRVPIRSQL